MMAMGMPPAKTLADAVPKMAAATIPGSTECASPSLINPRPRVTTYTPATGHITPTTVATISARTMKPY